VAKRERQESGTGKPKARKERGVERAESAHPIVI
jgi:hypothetical protein